MREILIAGGLALFFSLFGTPLLIKALVRKGYGQVIRDDGPSSHHTKRGTPTMGGIIIIFSVIASYLIAHFISGNTISTSAVLILGLVFAIGLLGFLDDYVKISRQNSGGISGKQKIAGQVVAASIFGYLGLQFADKDGYTPLSLQLSTVRDTSITLGVVAVVIWIAFMVTATSNGVNLTDGLDGLATGAAVMTFIAYVLIGVWEFGQSCAVMATSNCYQVRDPLAHLARISGKDLYGRYRFPCLRRCPCWNCGIASHSITTYSTRWAFCNYYPLSRASSFVFQDHRRKASL